MQQDNTGVERSWSSEAAPTVFLISLDTLLISSVFCCKPYGAQPLVFSRQSVYSLPKHWYSQVIFLFHCFVVSLCCTTQMMMTKSTVILTGVMGKQRKHNDSGSWAELRQPVAQPWNMPLGWDRQAGLQLLGYKLWKGQGDTWRPSHCHLFTGPRNTSSAQRSSPEPGGVTNFITCHSSTCLYKNSCLLCKYSLS